MRSVSRAIAISAAVAALSLLLPWALAFDPQSWVIWGHDIVHGHLDTAGGPSWKPLPVLVTTILAPAGQAAEALWVAIARASGLMALCGAYMLGDRLAGRTAAVGAAVAMLLGPWWLFNTGLGNSEGLLAALVLFAVLAHLENHRVAALWLLLGAGLLRPEIWPFLGLYGLWLLREGHRVAPFAAAAVLLVGWLAPDALGTGGLFKASEIARGAPSPGSAALARVPFLAVLWDAVQLVTIPAFIAILAGLRGRTERWIGAAAGVYVLEVAVSTQLGYAGNPRYLVPAAALGAVLAGCGAARLPRPVTAALAVALIAVEVSPLSGDAKEINWRAGQRETIGAVIGRPCGIPRSGGYWRALVAARLHVPLAEIDQPAKAPGTLFRSANGPGEPLGPAPPATPFAVKQRTRHWEVWTTCPRL
jgi:hypothetical protein